MGSWYSELKTENANTILETYLKPAVLTYERTYDTSSKIIEAYVSLGKFCDAQYQQIDAYMKSKDFEEKQELIVKLRENTAAM